MVDVIESSGQRLRLRLGGHGISTGLCTLDRENDLAEFAQAMFRIPYRRKRAAFSKIQAVSVKRKSRGKRYHPVLELDLRQTISLGGYSKEDALRAAQTIRDFLKAPRDG